MEEIKVGMYVRTSTVGIKKIEGINSKKSVWKYEYKLPKRLQDGDGTICCGLTREEDILKASYDIIDLIEEGDYVNGEPVISVEKFKDGSIYLIFSEDRYIKRLSDIETIVTKEQFKNMEYEVE